ncbi:MAG TPA: GNAT family N-acetyltransferase [Pirellulales bacterium]|nr:GNAT family N-acetyltransferase [Pirellulales bacterium]
MDDIEIWLELRRRTFERELPAIRAWSRDDFQAEFMAKPWWSPERLWFAEAALSDNQVASAIGAVALAMRAGDQPVIHWLMVLPEWRRRGVGRLLLNALEVACWDAGYRRIGLETHAAWSSAVEFYRAMGYLET